MTLSAASPNPAAAERLTAALQRLLGDSMGGEPGLGASGSNRPFIHALQIFFLYMLAWGTAEALAWLMGAQPRPRLVSLLAWGSVYIAARSYIVSDTTIRVKATIGQDVLPYASPALLDAVAADLERRIDPIRRIISPLLVATLCALAGIIAFARDLEVSRADVFTPEPLFGIAIFYLGFFISARSAAAAGFYISFARHLETEPDGNFFVLGAADSPLVQGLAKLANQVLVFWAMIFLAILSSMLLSLPWPRGFAFETNSYFLIVFVPVAGFISLGFGSLVYLRSEAKIRFALRRFTESQAAVLQQRMNARLDPLAGRIPADSSEIAQLTEWHDRILAGGRYGSRLGTAVSIALPLILPALSIVRTIYQSVTGTAG
jgi:hypothetical protein